MAPPSRKRGPPGPTASSTRTSSTATTRRSSGSRLTYDSDGKLVYRDVSQVILPLARTVPTRRRAARRAHASTKEGRAAARRVRAAARVQIPSVSYLKLRSVTPLTAERYAAGLRRLESFARAHCLPLLTNEQRDEAFESLFDQLFFAGSQAHEARYILFGAAFMMTFSPSPQAYPRAHRALRGWSRSAPGGTHAAMPWEAALLIAKTLATDGMKSSVVRDFAKSAAQALMLQFDTYLRPNYVLEIAKEDCLMPYGKATKVITVLIRRSDDIAEGSTLDVRRAQSGVERRRPGKTGDFDTAVRVGEPASAAAGRSFVVELLRRLHDDAPHRSTKLFAALNLPRYARALAWASQRADLDGLHLVPHSARHGGASADAAGGHRSLAEIQQRGLWKHHKSVARYRKPGLCQAQQARMTDDQRAAAQTAAAQLPRLLR